eukprot:6470577-Amphidinium_carterae.3
MDCLSLLDWFGQWICIDLPRGAKDGFVMTFASPLGGRSWASWAVNRELLSGVDEFEPSGLYGNSRMQLRIGGITAPSGCAAPI